MIDLTKYEAEAHALGIEAAKTAATWCTDGNTSQDHYRHVLALMDDGDPRADEYLPARPDLSGEWADGMTSISLYEELTGLDHSEQSEAAGLGYETLVGSVVDAIANAWEEGVGETFEIECERLMRQAIAPSDDVIERLEYLRQELRAERISYGELYELQGLAKHIEPGDVELLEAAGVPEHEDDA